MVSQWKSDNEITEWLVEKTCKPYQEKFDTVFDQLKLSYSDDLLAGMHMQIVYVYICMYIRIGASFRFEHFYL